MFSSIKIKRLKTHASLFLKNQNKKIQFFSLRKYEILFQDRSCIRLHCIFCLKKEAVLKKGFNNPDNKKAV